MNASGVFRMSKKPAEEGAPSGGDGEAKTLDDDVVEATAASGPVSVEGGSRAREEDARETDEERDRKRTKTSGDESEEDDYEMSSDDGEDEDESDDEDFKEATTRGRRAGRKRGEDRRWEGDRASGRRGGVDGGASAKVKVSATGAVRADRKSSDDPTPALLEALREYVAKCGGVLSDDWTCTATMRTQGASAGSYDALYWSPDGDRYRSRLEVVRALGLAPQRF